MSKNSKSIDKFLYSLKGRKLDTGLTEELVSELQKYKGKDKDYFLLQVVKMMSRSWGLA